MSESPGEMSVHHPQLRLNTAAASGFKLQGSFLLEGRVADSLHLKMSLILNMLRKM